MPSPSGRYLDLDLARTYLGPHARLLVPLVVALVGGVALQVLSPQLLRVFIDTVTSSGSPDRLVTIALLFLAASVVQQALTITTVYLSERVSWSATNTLRADLTLHCLRLDLPFHARRTPGELVERVDGDVTAIASFFTQFVLQVLGNLLLLVGILAALWHEDPRVGTALTIYTLLALALMLRLRGLATPYWTAFRQSSAELFGFLEERLAGTEDIRSSGATAHVVRQLCTHTRERLRTGRLARLASAVPWGLPILFTAVGTALAFTTAGLLYVAGAMTLGTAFVVYYYTRLLAQPVSRITNQMEELQRANAGLTRIQELRQVRPVIQDGWRTDLPPGALAVQLAHVTFSYAADDPVLRDVSFRVEPGSTVGVVGRTGSGKTTIARLLTRLYDAPSGVVRVGGMDVRELRRAALRRRLGMVTQDVQLFRASLRDNLTLFDPDVRDSRLLDALDLLGLSQWVTSLPQGLDTVLESGGGGLSAGEAQLLALGRVFLRDPGLVILDEPSSRLDPATERLVDRAIAALLAGRTGIVIAHRLETILRLPQVLVLQDGGIQEQGAPGDLVADPSSIFAGLVRAAPPGVPA